MKPDPRIRKVVKWGGPAVLAVLVPGAILSAVYPAAVRIGDVNLIAAEGCLTLSGMGPDTERSSATMIRVYDPEPFQLAWRLEWYTDAFGWMLSVPIWLPAAMVIVLTVIAWKRAAIARRREQAAVCPSCVYDRCGLPASAPCPECGHAAPTPQQPAN